MGCYCANERLCKVVFLFFSMPVQFLTEEQRAGYGRFLAEPTSADLAQYFHLDDEDRRRIEFKRGEHNQLGFAIQLTAVRYLGRFLEDVSKTPLVVLECLAQQLEISDTACINDYQDQRQRFRHVEEICQQYGYREFNDPIVGFRLTRWLYAQCWTGTDRPSLLFERATSWLLTHKVLLPGASVLERFIARLRQRVESRLWQYLIRSIPEHQQKKLEDLLQVPEESRYSWLDQLREGPTQISGPSLVRALERLDKIRSQGITLPAVGSIPPCRIAALARFASRSKVSAIIRLPAQRRLATLAAFMHTLEASAQDDALDIVDALLHEIFTGAAKADRKARLRTLRDLDAAATTLAEACTLLLNTEISDTEVRSAIFTQFSREQLEQALKETYALVRPHDDVFYRELQALYRRVRLFFPALVSHIHLQAGPAGKALVDAWHYLQENHHRRRFDSSAPLEIVDKSWQSHVISNTKMVDPKAYTFCVLDHLRTALKRRDVFIAPSWRYADPRLGLLCGKEWETAKPMICRTLGYL